MRKDTREFAGDGSVHHFHDVEVGGEEDVEVALMDLLPLAVFLHTSPSHERKYGNSHKALLQAPSSSDTWFVQPVHSHP